MASLRRHHDTKYWFACYTGPDGRRYQKSTRETEKRRAQKIAEQYEQAAAVGRMGLLTDRHARKVIAEIFRISNRGQDLQSDTVGEYFTRWLESKKARMKPKGFSRYSQLTNDFLHWAEGLSNFGLQHLSSVHLAKFRDDYLRTKSPATVNTALTVIQTALQDACDDRLLDFNEATRVERLNESTGRKHGRRPFTRLELDQILTAANDEWRGMTLAGLYVGGSRLGDIADLCWPHIDFDAGEARFEDEKTGKVRLLPIAGPLLRYWKSLIGDRTPRGPLFPKAYAVRQRGSVSSQLSNQFRDILVKAGIAEKRSHHKRKHGRSAKRESAGLGFHCLRYTATSLLKNAGVSDAITREIVGHESAAVSRIYTKFERATLADALNKLPDLIGDRS
jgi:integrase